MLPFAACLAPQSFGKSPKLPMCTHPPSLPYMKVYSFPVASITNYHKLSSLKQHIPILLQFWKSGV